MRFVGHSLDIPDELVTAQERGELLFVCGAGLSRTAGLPSFVDLVKGVYGRLKESWVYHPAESEVMDEGGALHGQYDRALRALERRLGADDRRGSAALRQRMRHAIDEQLRFKSDADLSNHLALLELSRDSDDSIRLLTTNFDCGFELAWRTLLTAPVSHAGPALPRPGSAAFSGVFHLHGRMEDAGFPSSEYVLTSAEFGEAYLRSGWASRYVYDLARTHTLVLVGYGADDPPMRYLLEVLEDDRGRYPDMRPVHAFDAVEPARRAIVEALWQAKGIVPHLYDGTDAGSHTRFYATLRAWRDYAARPSQWRSERLSHIVRKPVADVSNDDVKEALALLSRVQTYLDMWNLSPHASWWTRVIADGRLDASILGAWIAAKADQEEMLQACIHKPPGYVRTFDAVLRLANQNNPPLAEPLARGWKLLAGTTRDAEQRPFVEMEGARDDGGT